MGSFMVRRFSDDLEFVADIKGFGPFWCHLRVDWYLGGDLVADNEQLSICIRHCLYLYVAAKFLDMVL